MENQNIPFSLRVDGDLMVLITICIACLIYKATSMNDIRFYSKTVRNLSLFSFAELIQLSLPLFIQLILVHQDTTEGRRIILRQDSRN
ncbi:hypothetical protein EUGRSUZ_B01288 [Eucalyptus grandis]|uniref:Uncharacterized protein n=2 Tax=Eucalyptus grandis TaxID=71139 RepID=A0ACC3LPU3_EUCGR|nr:hypothetical protein EUGRSUZ_B01288 [Eucalyptus grandis]